MYRAFSEARLLQVTRTASATSSHNGPPTVNPTGFPAQGRLAGIDYGTVRIGVAVTDASRILASPLENYNRRSVQADADYFRRLADDEQIAGFVVGLPVHSSGDESQKSIEARRFGQWLHEITGRPVTFYDERFTSAQARNLLDSAELTKKKRRSRLDKVAAQIILASFLESHSAGGVAPGSLDD
ncbi:MAG: Holliday junction resolvase RuvX [Pirellulaceae bacterium]|nr:Holliday junction resolvase RuvX [Pirellulaceae bacterium]